MTSTMKEQNYKHLKPGDIIKVDLSPTIGHEQSDYRPVIVISNVDYNKEMGGLIMVLPISNRAKPFPTHFQIETTRAIISGQVFTEHVRTLDLDTRPFKLTGDSVTPEILTKCVDYVRRFF